MIACPAKRENLHVVDYYNTVFVYANTWRFHNEQAVRLLNICNAVTFKI